MPGATSAAGGQRAKKRCRGSGRLFASWTTVDGEAMDAMEIQVLALTWIERGETAESTRADVPLNGGYRGEVLFRGS